jgi:hypothetical protein
MKLEDAVSDLRAMPVRIASTDAITDRGRRRRHRRRLVGAVTLGVTLLATVAAISLIADRPADQGVATSPPTRRTLVLPDGSRLTLTAPQVDEEAGTRFTVATSRDLDAADAGECCPRDITIFDSVALAREDSVRSPDVVSSTVRPDGVVVDTIGVSRENATELRFHIGDWVVVLPVGGDGFDRTMDTKQVETWRTQLDGVPTADGVTLQLPAGWSLVETAAPIASVDGIGILGPSTQHLQCSGDAHQVGAWTVYSGDALRLCQPQLPVVLGLSAATPDARLSEIAVAVERAGPLLTPNPAPESADGLSVDVPHGWSLTDSDLSTYMFNPHELFVVSTAAIDSTSAQGPACDAQIPTAVVNPTTPSGVFVLVMEQSGPILGPGQPADQTPPPRPDAMTSASMSDIECGDLAHLYNLWFEQNGRWLGVYVGIGAEASSADQDLAFAVANSIRTSQ